MKKNFLEKYKSLEFVQDIFWDEVFEEWKRGEASQKYWKRHWEERGYDSWEEWRKSYVRPLNPENLKWRLFRVSNPTETVFFMYGVPSKGWIERAYGGETTKQLKDILNHPVVRDNEKVESIRNNFPEKTILTGIVSEGRIVLIEGMHRALALATWNSERKFSSEVLIALAEWQGEIPIVGSGSKQ